MGTGAHGRWLQRRSLVALGLGAALFGAVVVSVLDRHEACPRSSGVEHALAVRFAPGLVEHQNWVTVATLGRAGGTSLVLCVDGLIVASTTVDEIDFHNGIENVKVPTRWVDWQWLTGRLDDYRNLDRWSVVVGPGPVG